LSKSQRTAAAAVTMPQKLHKYQLNLRLWQQVFGEWLSKCYQHQ